MESILLHVCSLNDVISWCLYMILGSVTITIIRKKMQRILVVQGYCKGIKGVHCNIRNIVEGSYFWLFKITKYQMHAGINIVMSFKVHCFNVKRNCEAAGTFYLIQCIY